MTTQTIKTEPGTEITAMCFLPGRRGNNDKTLAVALADGRILCCCCSTTTIALAVLSSKTSCCIDLKQRPCCIQPCHESNALLVGADDGTVGLIHCDQTDNKAQPRLTLKHAWNVLSGNPIDHVFLGRSHSPGIAFLAGTGNSKITCVSTRPTHNFAVLSEVTLKEDVLSASLVEPQHTTRLWGSPAFKSNFFVANANDKSVAEWRVGPVVEGTTAAATVPASALSTSTTTSEPILTLVRIFPTAHELHIERLLLAAGDNNLFTAGLDMQVGRLDVSQTSPENNFSLVCQVVDFPTVTATTTTNNDEENFLLALAINPSLDLLAAASKHVIKLLHLHASTIVNKDDNNVLVDPSLDAQLQALPDNTSIQQFLETVPETRQASEILFRAALDLKSQQSKLLAENHCCNDNNKDDVAAFGRLPPAEYAFHPREIDAFLASKQAETDKFRHNLDAELAACKARCADIKRTAWDDKLVPLKTISGFSTAAKVSNFDIAATTNAAAANTNNRKGQRSSSSSSTSQNNVALLLFGNVRDPALRSILDHFGPTLHAQHELNTIDRKQQQVAALNNIIYELQTHLNAEFDALLADKSLRLQHFARAKTRTHEIQDELTFLHQRSLPAKAVQFLANGVSLPPANFEEHPELIFESASASSAIEKLPQLTTATNNADATAAQTQTSTSTTAAAATTTATTTLGNSDPPFRSLALMDMMNGVLEPKRKDALFKEVPVPQFVLAKPADEWDANEQAAHAAYKAQLHALDQRRNDYKNELLTEIDAMESSIKSSKREFDSRLDTLASLKVDVATLVARAEFAVSRLLADVRDMQQLEAATAELDAQARQLLAASREAKAEMRALDPVLAATVRIRTQWSERGAQLDRDASDIITKSAASAKTQESAWCAFKSHPATFSSAVASVLAKHDDNLSDACKPVSIGEIPTLAQELDEMDTAAARPTGLPAETWQKLTALRRERLACDLNHKLADNVGARCQAQLEMAATKFKAAEAALDEKRHALRLLAQGLDNYRLQPEVQFVAPLGLCELDQYAFDADVDDLDTVALETCPSNTTRIAPTTSNNHNASAAFIAVPKDDVVHMDSQLRAMAEQSSNNFRTLAAIRERLERAQWDETEYVDKCEQIFRELHEIDKFKLDREARNFLSNGLETCTFSAPLTHLEADFVEKRVTDLERRCSNLQEGIRAKMEENEELDRKVTELENALQHPLSTMDLTSMFAERLEPIWREKQLQDLIGLQKDRIVKLEKELETLNMRTYPTLANGQ
ncbi:unnamed protein product [Notodromas monacha]|uniref:Cilia- and flagella-associated protein 43 n=1 Tax=Notodromas monacha TaxID=399045 RepID=A0A7R9BVD3_9CRUS|nr:unnamed protein product [Notodromas monacha]CAG0922077.1 unnamed protein product [Notodromas monacha]